MPAALLGPFHGISPRFNKSRLNKNYADIARDVDLSDATLRPWREPEVITDTQTHNGYFCGCEFVDIEECECADEVNGRCEQIVVSGVTPAVIGTCPDDFCELHFPCPPTAPTITGTADTPSRTTSARQYVYTYLRFNGDESPPSYPSTPLTLEDGTSVTVSGFTQPQSSQCVEYINIYRLATGYRSGGEEVREEVSAYRLVARVLAGTLTFTDTVIDKDLGEVNFTEGRKTAPEDLKGVHAFGHDGAMIGYTNTTVRQSIPGEPHWWPLEFQTNIGEVLTGLAVHDRFAIAFTNSNLYLIKRGDPATMQCPVPEVLEFEATQLVNRDCRRWVKTRFGMVYVSDEGLILVSSAGEVRNITSKWFSAHDWRQIKPETMRIGADSNTVMFVTDTHGYHLDISSDIEFAELTEISDRPTRFISGVTNDLLLLEGNEVRQWNAGALKREYVWGKLLHTRPSVFRRLMGSSEGLVELSVNGATTIIARDCDEKRMAKYRKNTKHDVELRGSYELHKLNIASSSGELSSADF